MEGYAKMLHRFYTPYDSHIIYTHMPTEREHNRDNPEIKEDPSHFRPAWLDNLYFHIMPVGCSSCMIVRYIVLALAIVGIVSLLT